MSTVAICIITTILYLVFGYFILTFLIDLEKVEDAIEKNETELAFGIGIFLIMWPIILVALLLLEGLILIGKLFLALHKMLLKFASKRN